MDRTTIIRPAKMVFAFRLSKYDCYRKRTGKCSLLLSPDQYQKELIKEEPNSERYGECSVKYCVELRNSLIAHGNLSEIRLCCSTCGHWNISDGQHRLCIYKTLDLGDIEVTQTDDWEFECRVCYFKKKNLKFRLRSWFGKEEEFLR